MVTDCRLCTKFDMCYTTQDGDKPCMGYEQKKLTNADCIRAMTDEELAEFIANGIPLDVCHDKCGGDVKYQCSDCILEWLKQECES